MSAVEKLRALLAKATHGPWRHRTKLDDGTEHHDVLSDERDRFTGDDWEILVHGGNDCERCAAVPVEPENAALIVAAVNALPALLDGIEAAREAAGLLYLARKRCACWGKMTGSCMTCARYRDGEEAINAALAKLVQS